jgi:hypothetical protein
MNSGDVVLQFYGGIMAVYIRNLIRRWHCSMEPIAAIQVLISPNPTVTEHMGVLESCQSTEGPL